MYGVCQARNSKNIDIKVWISYSGLMDPSAPTVPPPSEDKLPYLKIIAFVVFLALIPVSFYLYKHKAELSSLVASNIPFISKPKPQAVPKVLRQGTITEIESQINSQSLPNLFYADLEYDPKTGLVQQISTDTIKGETPSLWQESPKSNLEDKFVYEIEIISKNNEILLSGWTFEYKEIIQQTNGNYKFKVTVPYYPDSQVRILLPNHKVLWTGLMPVVIK